MKILVVDDSDVVLAVTRNRLEDEGHEVVTHSRATGCVAIALEFRPDLILVDVNMPGLGGDMVVKMLDGTRQTSNAVVLLHSTLPSDELERRARASGAHGYICKTDNAFAFNRQVQRWLGNRSSKSATEREVVARKPPEADAPASPRGRLDGILFVDGNMQTLAAYRDAAQRDGFDADLALSVQQAVAKLKAGKVPAFIVADAELGAPGVDGFFAQLAELERALQSRFFVTVERSEAASTLAKRFGDRILQKPVSTRALTDALRNAGFVWR
jgi:DNA-binding response OmpR family regulator